jgi:hypothetical protein
VNGTWAKGATTAKNEKRFVTEMQQRKIDYKSDGFKQIMEKLKIESTQENPFGLNNVLMINTTT